MGDRDHVIRTRNLTRYFGRKRAACGLDLAVPRGSVFAFLGLNGSGKTTTIRMLLGLLEPTRGSAEVLGEDSRRLTPSARARIGYLAEGHPIFPWMRVGEAERFQSRFYPRWNREIFRAVVSHFHLDPRTRAGDLSKGERAGLCLALTLSSQPELLILDDPALGLDPVARRSLLEAMVHVTRKADRTIFFSSHLLSDVERVADWVAVLDRGVLRAQCPMETFRGRVRQYVLRYPGDPPGLPPIPGLVQAVRRRGEVRLTIANPGDGTREALGKLGAATVEEVPLSLEDAFISYLGARGERSFILSEVESVQDGEEMA